MNAGPAQAEKTQAGFAFAHGKRFSLRARRGGRRGRVQPARAGAQRLVELHLGQQQVQLRVHLSQLALAAAFLGGEPVAQGHGAGAVAGFGHFVDAARLRCQGGLALHGIALRGGG